MKKTKSLSKLKKELQLIFNTFIRLRDKDKPCISSGEYHNDKDCGHYFPVGGFDSIRFDEDNAHGESIRMNRFDDSHLIYYGENLKVRIGLERYEALKQRADDYKMHGYKWSRSDLIEKIQYYKDKLKEF